MRKRPGGGFGGNAQGVGLEETLKAVGLEKRKKKVCITIPTARKQLPFCPPQRDRQRGQQNNQQNPFGGQGNNAFGEIVKAEATVLGVNEVQTMHFMETIKYQQRIWRKQSKYQQRIWRKQPKYQQRIWRKQSKYEQCFWGTTLGERTKEGIMEAGRRKRIANLILTVIDQTVGFRTQSVTPKIREQ